MLTTELLTSCVKPGSKIVDELEDGKDGNEAAEAVHHQVVQREERRGHEQEGHVDQEAEPEQALSVQPR